MAAGSEQVQCHICETISPATAIRCATCGASLFPGMDVIMAELDDLETATDGVLADELDTLSRVAEEESAVADHAIGELAAVEQDVALVEARLAEEEADLSAFVAKLEASPHRAGPRPLPRAHPGVAPVLGAAALVAAVGIFLLPSYALGGAVALVASVVLAAAGWGLRAVRAAPQ